MVQVRQVKDIINKDLLPRLTVLQYEFERELGGDLDLLLKRSGDHMKGVRYSFNHGYDTGVMKRALDMFKQVVSEFTNKKVQKIINDLGVTKLSNLHAEIIALFSEMRKEFILRRRHFIRLWRDKENTIKPDWKESVADFHNYLEQKAKVSIALLGTFRSMLQEYANY